MAQRFRAARLFLMGEAAAAIPISTYHWLGRCLVLPQQFWQIQVDPGAECREN
jgi:hypothetical protein